MHLVLIRHGQSTNNALNVRREGMPPGAYPGRVSDPDLSEVGHLQAQLLADAAVSGAIDLPLSHLYCSLTLRATRTAAPLAKALDLPCQPHPDAHEIWGTNTRDPRTGVWEAALGASLTTLREANPCLEIPGVAMDPEVDVHEPWEGGFELADNFSVRAARFVADIAARHGDDDVVGVVTHQGFAQQVASAILGMPSSVDKPRTLGGEWILNNTGLVWFELGGQWPVVRYYNRHDHLPAQVVTGS